MCKRTRGRQSEMPGGTGTCSEVSPELLSCPPSANELSAFHLVFVSATVKLQLHTCNDEQSYELEFHSKKNLHKIVSTACNNVRCRYFFSPRHLKFDQSLENPIWSLIRVLNSLENPRAPEDRDPDESQLFRTNLGWNKAASVFLVRVLFNEA